MGSKNLGSLKVANRLGVLYFASLTQRSNRSRYLDSGNRIAFYSF